MHRHLAAVAALGILFAAAGCSGESTPSSATPAAGPVPAAGATSAAPVDPAAAASADAALSGNTRAICEQAARTSESFGKTFVADLKLQIDAAGKGGAAKTAAEDKIKRDVQNYSYALADMARLSDDKKLKTALTQMSAEVKAVKGDITKIDAEKMSELTATLDKACGKG
jgi:ABC-type phosphate transport system substrate-binding protein